VSIVERRDRGAERLGLVPIEGLGEQKADRAVDKLDETLARLTEAERYEPRVCDCPMPTAGACHPPTVQRLLEPVALRDLHLLLQATCLDRPMGLFTE
jgi:hypothetical protein